MLHEVFYWVLNMSIVSSVFGILLYFIRFIKGFPKFFSYILWGVVLFRLICPLGISSEYSLLNLVSKITQKAYVRTVTLHQVIDHSTVVPGWSFSNTIQAANEYGPITYTTNSLDSFFKIASVVWVIVSLSAIIAMVILYILTKSELKRARHLCDNIYEGAMVDTPTVYGILRAKIVLPLGMKKEHLEYILAHEKVHIKRHDNIWRMTFIIAACIHWFNPLIWVFLKSFLNDCEYACDEKVVKNMNEEDKKNYARTLLAYGTADTIVFSSAFGSNKVKVRIKNVLSYKKLTLFSSISFLGMMVVIAYILLTNAVA